MARRSNGRGACGCGCDRCRGGRARHCEAAGLDAQAVSRSIDGLPTDQIPPRRLAKGSYYVLNRPSPFQRLIYPMPEHGGLGIHATLDLGGRARFGPDVEWIEAPDYAVTEAGAQPFLFRRAPLLAQPRKWNSRAGLCGNPSQNRGSRGTRGRLCHARSRAAPGREAHRALWDRVAGTHCIACYRRRNRPFNKASSLNR
jgi:hypothetical protein